MGRLQYKKDISRLLESNSFRDSVDELYNFPEHIVVNQLFSALCHPHSVARWNAVFAFGYIVPKIAERDMEAARVIMRRCLWSMNDESGGIGWGIPEAMAEIICHHDRLRAEYVHMLISYMREDGEELFQDGNYLELPMLQRGLLWGVGRLCDKFPEEMLKRGVFCDLIAYLNSPDTTVVGHAILALEALGERDGISYIQPFLGNSSEITIFEDWQERNVTIAQLAETAVIALQK